MEPVRGGAVPPRLFPRHLICENRYTAKRFDAASRLPRLFHGKTDALSNRLYVPSYSLLISMWETRESIHEAFSDKPFCAPRSPDSCGNPGERPRCSGRDEPHDGRASHLRHPDAGAFIFRVEYLGENYPPITFTPRLPAADKEINTLLQAGLDSWTSALVSEESRDFAEKILLW